MQETWVQSLGQEDPLEKGMATHSSILAWKILWTEEPGGLQSRGLQSRTWLNDYTTTKLLYKVVFVSAVWQSEPVICRHISPPSWTSLPPEMLSMLLGSRISGSHDNLFNMLKNHLTISVVTTSFLIPVIDWGFQLLHILTVAWMGVWLYLIHIFPLTNDVELFSCAYCPFVYLLRRNILIEHLPIFNWFLFLLFRCRSSHINYTFFHRCMIEQYFSHIVGYLFTFLIVSFEAQNFVTINSNISKWGFPGGSDSNE